MIDKLLKKLKIKAQLNQENKNPNFQAEWPKIPRITVNSWLSIEKYIEMQNYKHFFSKILRSKHLKRVDSQQSTWFTLV